MKIEQNTKFNLGEVVTVRFAHPRLEYEECTAKIKAIHIAISNEVGISYDLVVHTDVYNKIPEHQIKRI